MSTTIPEDLLYQWSITADEQVLIDAQDYIRQDFESGLSENLECWRGSSTNHYVKAYQPGELLVFDRSVSWTTELYSAEMFADIAVDSYGGEKIIYHMESAEMLDISDTSNMTSEKELLSHPDSKFRVISVDYDDDSGYFVELEEVF